MLESASQFRRGLEYLIKLALGGRSFEAFAALLNHITFYHGDLAGHYVNQFFATQGGGGAERGGDGTNKE